MSNSYSQEKQKAASKNYKRSIAREKRGIELLDAMNLGQERELMELACRQENEDVARFIMDYESFSRLYCIPQLSVFDPDNMEHRLDNLFFGGLPFTSLKWPWPINSNKERLYPISQIDLEIAGDKLRCDLGDGILQIWGEYLHNLYDGFLQKNKEIDNSNVLFLPFSELFEIQFRVIPREDLRDEIALESLSNIISDGDKLFSKFADVVGTSRNLSRVTWQSARRMYYPSFNDFVQGSAFWPVEHGVRFPHDLDDELNRLKVTTSNVPWFCVDPACILGGYPPTLYHRSIDYNANILLLFRHHGDFAVTFEHTAEGNIEFSMESHYDSLD